MALDLRSKIRDRIKNSETHFASSDPKTVFVDKVWPALQGDYDTMRKQLDGFCTHTLKDLGIKCEISSRTKTRDSIEKSLQRREEALKTEESFATLTQVLDAIHDLVGLRIVLHYPNDFHKATKFINDTFHKERDPTTFLPDREVGIFWRPWFGAYQTVNHRLCLQSSNLETLSNGDPNPLLQFCGVLFEIQLTTFEENLYNELAHPLLYKKSSGQLTLQEEQILDMAHGAARFYTLCKVFLKSRLQGTPEPADQRQIVKGTRGFVRSLAEAIPIEGPGGGFESPPEGCNTIEDLKEWLNTRLEDVFGKLEKMNSPSSLRRRVQWEEAPCEWKCNCSIAGVVANRPSLVIVPYTSNPGFVGRAEILNRLKEELGHTELETVSKRTSQARAGLYGLGGIGKTQIALKYIYWLRAECPDVSVFWVHASNAERFSEAYASIAQECNIPGRESPGADILTLVKKWLETKDGHRWMMVIDNADDAELFTPPGGLGKHIPDYAYGSLLVTTRNKIAGSRLLQARPLIEVGNMDEADSKKLLQERLQRDDADTNMLSKLSSRLEHLPLALAQAAAFIQENAISVQQYIELLDKNNENQADLLSEEFETVGRDSESSRAVAKTWILSFEQIQLQNHLVGELLSLMSLFDRQEIPMEFLNNYINRPTLQTPKKRQSAGEVECIKALGVLKAFSFITQDKGDNFSMHRLVQLVTRRWLNQNGTMPQFAEQAIFAVAKAYPYGKHENRVNCGKYLPHVYAVLELTGTESTDEKIARAHILFRAGSFLWYRGQWRDAEKLERKAVNLRAEVLGHNDSDTLASMGNLASTYQNQGRWKEAESLQLQVLETSKSVLGKEHPDTLTNMHNLASTYRNQGRWKEAESLQIQQLETSKSVLGKEHPDTLTSMHNLASTYQNQGRWKEAESLQIQQLETSKSVLGKEHPDTLTSMHNLTSTYRNQGRWKEAESLQLQVLETRKSVLGEEHPDILTSMHNLASIYQNQGRWEEAELVQLQVLETSKSVLGEEHPHTLASMHNLTEKVIGPDHPYTIDSRKQLAHWMKEERTTRSTKLSAEEEDSGQVGDSRIEGSRRKGKALAGSADARTASITPGSQGQLDPGKLMSSIAIQVDDTAQSAAAPTSYAAEGARGVSGSQGDSIVTARLGSQVDSEELGDTTEKSRSGRFLARAKKGFNWKERSLFRRAK
ncbi:kinesin light chain [Cladorrhinum sp. PSN332]|nr:kinesin light chain [Cladorrhinum sp. PSN332]